MAGRVLLSAIAGRFALSAARGAHGGGKVAELRLWLGARGRVGIQLRTHLRGSRSAGKESATRSAESGGARSQRIPAGCSKQNPGSDHLLRTSHRHRRRAGQRLAGTWLVPHSAGKGGRRPERSVGGRRFGTATRAVAELSGQSVLRHGRRGTRHKRTDAGPRAGPKRSYRVVV